MPLILNCGLSKKQSKDFQSSGIAVSLTAEVDSALLDRPQQLQEKISALYQQAELALNRRLSVTDPAGSQPVAGANRGARRPDGNHRPATASQLKALRVMAQHRQLDLDSAAEREFGVAADDLSVEEASRLIDLLKNKPVAERISSNGNGVHR